MLRAGSISGAQPRALPPWCILPVGFFSLRDCLILPATLLPLRKPCPARRETSATGGASIPGDNAAAKTLLRAAACTVPGVMMLIREFSETTRAEASEGHSATEPSHFS